jgi:dihydropyrimidine dehydrogenase (NAD+) subunit PreA/dihydroorotate dehydrogenase (NAD+) catalytic subunit
VTDLSVDIAGLRLKNPVIAAASEFTMTEAGIRGCLDAGAAAVVAKSVNESAAAARQLDTAEYTLLRPDWSVSSWDVPSSEDTLFNRSGLAQVKLDDWLDTLRRTDADARTAGAYVIGSVTVAQPAPAAEIAARLATAVRCIELNLGTPHARLAVEDALSRPSTASLVEDYTRRAKDAIGKATLIVKLGSEGDVVDQAKAAFAGGADAVAMIGRYQGFIPDVDSWEPVLGTAAAVGGGWSLPLSLYWVSACRQALGPEAPLIGTNGARSGLDVVRFLLSGARAVEMASAVLMRGPAALSAAVREVERYAAGRGMSSLEELIGAAADRALPYSKLKPRPQRRPWERFYHRKGGHDVRD